MRFFIAPQLSGLARNAMVGVLFVLSACGDIPQPFRHEGLNPAVAPAAARGVVVRPVDDLPRSTQLAEVIVRRLLEAEIPASTRPVVSGAWVIAADLVSGSDAVRLRWHLTRADGEELGGLEQTIPAGTWARFTPKTMEIIAAEVVDKLSVPLSGGTKAQMEAQEAAMPKVRLLALSGLPGDGDAMLFAAMRKMLEGRGLKLVESGVDFQVRGQVTLSPGHSGEEVLAVSWTVMDRNGESLGTASQQGGVPKGRLSAPWGSLAKDIAAGGVDGILEILRAAAGK